MRATAVVTIVLAAACSACATSYPLPEARTPGLAGKWALQDASSLPSYPQRVELSLMAQPASAETTRLTIRGFSGVNHFAGRANANLGNQYLIIGALATSQRIGPASSMTFEKAFLKQMQQVVGFELQGTDKLILRTIEGETLTFLQASR